MLLYRFPLIRLPMCYFNNLGCPMLWAALGSPGLLWVALGYPGLFGAAQGCSGGAAVQIHTWMYWGHMWHPWHLCQTLARNGLPLAPLGCSELLWAARCCSGLPWECSCANTHLAVLGAHVASMAPVSNLGAHNMHMYTYIRGVASDTHENIHY